MNIYQFFNSVEEVVDNLECLNSIILIKFRAKDSEIVINVDNSDFCLEILLKSLMRF